MLSLAPTPPANAFVPVHLGDVPQACFPLDLYFCDACAHVQLIDVIDPGVLFAHYVYVSGTSPSFVRHFQSYAADLGARFPRAEGLVLDIGSNDGTLLGFFKAQGFRVLGVDPAVEISAAASSAGIETLNAFFSPALASDILSERGPATIITANNVFAHIDDLSSVAEGVARLLSPSGLFAFEVSYLGDVVASLLFDTIYHEHLDYHTVLPLLAFLCRCGLEVVEVQRVPTHGGSIRVIAQRLGGQWPLHPSVAAMIADETRLRLHEAETFKRLGLRINALGAELRRTLVEVKAKGGRIAGFGAPAKATTLMYHFGIGPETVDFIVDDSPLKQGLLSPGMHIPIMPASEIARARPDYLLILAWNFAREIILKNEAFREEGGRFIIPLPHVEVL